MPTGCFALRGSAHHKAKLSESDVLEIRALASTLTQSELARNYGVSRPAIRNVLTGKGWTHVGGERVAGGARKLGPKAHNWKGGTRRNGRYLLVLMPNHPNADRKGYVRRARLVLEQKIGRPLLPDEHAHHINHDTLDDRPENLQLLTADEHMRLHADERRGHRWHDKPTNWKVTREMAAAIASVAGSDSDAAIARQFGVSHTVVRQIRRGTHWSSHAQ